MTRKRMGYALAGVLVAALAGCGPFGSKAASTGAASTGAASTGAPSGHAASGLANASGSGSASAASPSPTAAALLGILPVPAGANPWSQNTNSLLGRVAFVQAFYVKSAWTEEEGLFQRRGFVSGVHEGWFNADGTQQSIDLMRFASASGAVSEFDGLTGTLKDDETKSETMISDSRDGGTGIINPVADSLGNTQVELVTHLGDYVIDVHEYVPVTPDSDAAKALLLQQYQAVQRTQPGSTAG